jgi:hypothetical protein
MEVAICICEHSDLVDTEAETPKPAVGAQGEHPEYSILIMILSVPLEYMTYFLLYSLRTKLWKGI